MNTIASHHSHIFKENSFSTTHRYHLTFKMLKLTKFPSFHSSHQQYTTVKLRLPNRNWSAQHIVNKTHRAKARFLSSKCGIFPNFISSLKMDMYTLSPDPLALPIPTIIREPLSRCANTLLLLFFIISF